MSAPDLRQNVETICKVSRPREELAASFSEEVVMDVLGKGKPLVFSKDYCEEQAALADTLRVQKIKSVMCVPLVIGQRLMGAMYVDSVKRPDGFRKEDLFLLLDIGQRVALAVETNRLTADLAGVAADLMGSEQ